ncbi:MAG TPA: GGDEF domain-containing protein [Egicoccus sp.]|nr:GGDEF domain-containing protein [Egicoccus sp.]HSK22413.1 GGDEF domain-containing protein [Egicoccus sp.]
MNERDLLRVLVEFATTLTDDFSIQEILERLTEQIVGLLPVTGAGVLLMDGGGDHHFVSATDEQLRRIEGLQVELGEGPCLTAYETDQPVAVVDLSCDVRYPRFSPAASTAGLGAVFSFPLRHGGGRIGALELYASEPVVLSADELDGGQTLADVTASYLSIARRREGAARAALVLAEAAVTDPLTGLANRRLLKDRLDQAMDRSGRSGRVIAVLFCDIDRFKAVNDRFGHHVGDRLLVELAARLTGCLRPEDTLARVSGDEFVIVCEDLTDPSQAQEVAARVLAALAEPFSVTGVEQALVLSVSIGMALAGAGHGTPEAALIRADAAMYRAKQRGGNQQVDAAHLSLAEGDREHTIDADLAAALAAGELHLEYQPIVDAVTERWTGVEALLRWHHDRLGPVAPPEILAGAERGGLTLVLGRWIMWTACRDGQRWREEHGLDAPAVVCVNVSFAELLHPGHAAMVAEVLAATGLPASGLVIEVTEHVPLADADEAVRQLTNLAALGIAVALDDFGTGYSSLTHVQTFPVDVLKLDRSFVTRISHDPTDDAIAGAVVALARDLGITVIAEGIETAEQFAHIRRLGIGRSQGYLHGIPVRAGELTSQLRAGAGPPDARVLHRPRGAGPKSAIARQPGAKASTGTRSGGSG